MAFKELSDEAGNGGRAPSGPVTSWIKPAPAITGQDHLGTIAPGESIYVDQLPGVTNVTARARYYSFYPWFFRELGRRHANASADQVVDLLRRAECLFTLVAVRHARVLDESDDLHGATMVGREKLVPAVEHVDPEHGEILLAEHADLESTQRYFMNPLGGLGQYYFGALRELGILGGDTRSRDIRYTEERGLPLANAFAASAEAQHFFETLRLDVVTVSDLDALATFCPCGLARNAPESRLLIDLIVDPDGRLGDEARTRRSTLALVIDLIGREAAPDYDFSREFRDSTYAGALLDGTRWSVPDQCVSCVRAWSTYGRHELLSVAFQGLFWAALTASEEGGRRRFRDAPQLAAFAVSQLRPALPTSDWDMPFANFVTTRPRPALEAWADVAHETQAGWRIVDRDTDAKSVTADALVVLASLVARDGGTDPYAHLHFEASYFERYPINLRTFLLRARGEWATMTVADVLTRAILWALRTHWRVALQKLAEAVSRDTFKVRPLEGSVQIVEAPSPTFSVPRIHRVVGILRDLGVVEFDDAGRPALTNAGETLRGGLLG